MKSLSIRTQVALMAVALTALSVASIAFTVIRSERVILKQQSRDRIEALIQGINRIAAESLVQKDPLMLPSDLMFLQKEHPELAFWEFTSNGFSHKSGPEAPDLTFVSRELTSSAFPVSTGESVARAAAPASAAPVSIRLGFKTRALQEEIDKPLDAMIRRTLEISGLLLIFGVIAAIYLSTVLTRPLGALASGAQSVGAGRLDVAVPVAGSRETRALAERFNEMTGHLKDFVGWRDYILQSLTHDMNTPLGGLKAYLELMEDGKFPSGEEGRRSVMTLLAAVARMQELLGNTLTFFKTQKNGQREIRRQAVNFAEMSREIKALFAPMAAIKKISVQDVTAEPAPCVLAERELLRQALTNLVSNALKYTPNGGTVRFGAQAHGDDVVLWVADNGRGIAKEDMPHIFEKFRRGKSGEGIPGTGLGLSIVRDAVVMMGGGIRVESWPGKGSRFVVTLPKARAQAPAPAPVPAREAVI
ncbi:MAG TPA: HAMP domain-containing sensor histidine kinase [Elusimicrobiota bacterium]|nr:HAMP domain-containing sensor histidine kinase [Elusimicrobiota bacterium]